MKTEDAIKVGTIADSHETNWKDYVDQRIALAKLAEDERLASWNNDLINRIAIAVSDQISARNPSEQITNLVQSGDRKTKYYMGTPTNDHLNKIHLLLNDTSTSAEDWFVCCVAASNDLINHDEWRWHRDVLKQMSKTTIGCTFLLDHDWTSADAAVGFIFDGELVQVPAAIALQMKACQVNENNKKIIKQQDGCVVYNTWVAIASNQSTIPEAIKTRRLNDVSTGGLLNRPQYICPICSEKFGRDVQVNEVDKKGNYICPHDLPGWGAMADALGMSIQESQEMPYCIKNGNYIQVETSFVNVPNYVDCGVLR